MSLADLPVLTLLRETMGFQSERQRVLAQNVANASTPGFTPSDISEASFHRALQAQLRGGAGAAGSIGAVSLSASHAGHIAPANTGAERVWRAEESPDSETTINGNSVVLEEQMVRASETRLRYDAAVTLYQKTLGLIRMAARPSAR